MPNTKIQLRGISRVPSDRLLKDGDCAESMNVIVKESEIVPMPTPKKVSDDLATGLSTSGIDVLYIHKTNTYTNYVGKLIVTENNTPVEKLVAYVFDHSINPAAWATKVVSTAVTFPVVSVTSIGNILIVSDGAGVTHYALYQDNAYKYLGTEIPKPTVRFRVTSETGASDTLSFNVDSIVTDYMNSHSGNEPSSYELWEYMMSNRGKATDTGKLADDFYNTLYQKFWDFINAERHSRLLSGVFSAPVLVRYAVRLYDGSYAHVSEPICLSNKANSNVPDFLAALTTPLNYMFGFTPVLAGCFSAKVDIGYSVANWADLIESVDIFLSTDIALPSPGAEFGTATDQTTNISVAFDGSSGDEVEDFKSKLDEVSNFYLVKSYTLNEMDVSFDTLSPLSQDNLVVKRRMSENVEAHFISAVGNLNSYNNRLVSGSQQITLSVGHVEPHAIADDSTGTKRDYYMYYHVRDVNGSDHLVQGYHVNELFYNSEVMAFVSYPDPKCYQADLYYGVHDGYGNTDWYKKELPMREHPSINCAYGFWGLDEELETGAVLVSGLPASASLNPKYVIDNRLALSEVDNPFVFPIDQRKRFSSRILTALPATIALSTNQSGPLPIYVFTEDGIWGQSITSEGGLATPFVVSRDVAINGTIAQLDQAIVFVSDKGVMIVQGRQVTSLSQVMNGRNFVPSEELINVIESYSEDAVIVDTVPFLAFAKGSRPAYDYAGNRIIFFNPEHPTFQYVLALTSQTWHRIKLPEDEWGEPRTFCVLNSYPHCLVFFGDEEAECGGEIVDFSTLLDVDAMPEPEGDDEPTYDVLPGLIVTRDINFGGNDVYKTIKRIRIRGDRFPEEEPWKYVLLGSNDRKNYHVLHSLRGPSWKFYRIAIATTMYPAGRISYIELDWEPRFTDRIR